MLGDAGLVDIPTGKRYIAAVMVQRPNNDPRAEKLISSISRAAYQQFSQNAVVPNSTTNTIPTTSYQPSMMPPGVPNSMGNPIGYRSPVMAPVLPNNMGYPPPVINPQYYPPR
jgi:beta-lactamase class A